jgi:hypothetical protein
LRNLSDFFLAKDLNFAIKDEGKVEKAKDKKDERARKANRKSSTS